ncbi:hypothetical protein J23TS9_05980 [Paenibacillus sp. J23TS9]|uniref:hypothetical protein n=1 Tax=Paenibacillus sp. J23TS9 TaxID=2807193 RepID=UPI001B0AC569|nr:hypothetical protein [Paenibacillus sp. J23TS9]GIP25468.1 hypothetical protein J23TS9_05980 [Paenibacillus sp. J23TS9]
MTLIGLLIALKKFFIAEFADLILSTRDGQEKAPGVAIGWPKAKEAGDSSQSYPYIIIRPTEYTDETGQDADSTVKVQIILGAYGEGEDGLIELMNLSERVRQLLQISGPIEKKYRMEPTYKWGLIIDEQTAGFGPIWNAVVTTEWDMQPVFEQSEYTLKAR